MLHKLLSSLSSLFVSRRASVLLCQDWTGAEARDTRMDSGAGGGAHHVVERRDLRQRNRSPAERYEKRGHRQSLSPPATEAPAVVSELNRTTRASSDWSDWERECAAGHWARPTKTAFTSAARRPSRENPTVRRTANWRIYRQPKTARLLRSPDARPRTEAGLKRHSPG